ncbi:hypothetical protein H5410_061034 [Solanum commersonii]|uniref:Uncharacterized protein n=1 Tax=Solanum commersonii TaxID=4109 RepID=A0A9J5W7S0_SOLCO|nr:hypothetical protein H5410_061034 [Solanum commersonii]
MLHGWVAEKRKRENGSRAFDMVGAIKKHCMKRKTEHSILKRKSATKK